MEISRLEENLKAEIYNIFIRCKNESPGSFKQKYCMQFCDLVFRWCKDYLFKEANEMGLEIFKMVRRLVKSKNSDKVSENKEKFFKYLIKSLYNEKKAYFRLPDNKPGVFKYPRILGEMKTFIDKQECSAGRNFTDDEKIQFISKWFDKSKKSAGIYLKMMNTEGAGNIHLYDENNKNILDFTKTKQLYIQETCEKSFEAMFIKKAVELVLKNSRKNTSEIYKSLFTIHCIKNEINLEEFADILDGNIINTYIESAEIPHQYEIYLRYHPNVSKKSAEARSSEIWKNFQEALKTRL